MSKVNGFKPYKAVDSGKTVSEVWDYVNSAVYFGHCLEDSVIKIDPQYEYGRLLDRLNELGIKTRTFAELAINEKLPTDEVTCVIRHDVDIDVVSALRTAQIEHEKGIRSSWYILHTSPYYGEWKSGTFSRNGCMRHVYRQIEALGHEIGLHTDGLHIYQNWNCDGATAVTTEIDWLRQSGLSITGTTAHNSVGAYGACNYAIFKGRRQHLWAVDGECPDFVDFNGNRALLQQLSETELGLNYECNDVFWQDSYSVAYGCIMSSDNWAWEPEKANPKILEQKKSQTYVDLAQFDAETLFERLATVPKGSLLNLVVHPVYYGARNGKNVEPAR